MAYDLTHLSQSQVNKWITMNIFHGYNNFTSPKILKSRRKMSALLTWHFLKSTFLISHLCVPSRTVLFATAHLFFGVDFIIV